MTKHVINKKIIGYAVKKENGDVEVVEDTTVADKIKDQPLKMNETVGRPDMLIGSTYKIKTPGCEHAMYITINDIILNEDTNHEVRMPYEIFVNSKNMEHFQWSIALTRVISAVFRKGGDVVFLVDELKAVFDPKGGFWEKGTFIPSLVAKIGHTIEHHLKRIGLIETEELSDHQKEIISKKLEDFKKKEGHEVEVDGYPKQATECPKCHERSLIRLDNCPTCIASNCGWSKCG